MASVTFTRPRKPAKTKSSGEALQPPTPSPSIRGEVGGGDSAGQEEKKSTVAEILAAAKLLAAAQRRQLLAELSLACQADSDAGTGPREKDMWATAVYEALDAALGATGGTGVGPAVLRRLLGAQSEWMPVADLMASLAGSEATVAERQAIYRALATLLIRRCRDVSSHTRAPLSPKLVANNVGQLRAIFDASFPGYLRSGLGKILAKRITTQGFRPDAG